MTKQEEIRDIMYSVAAGEIKAMTALQMLSDLGVVIIDRDRELPEIPLFGGILAESSDKKPTQTSYKLAQQGMLDAGFGAFEPLREGVDGNTNQDTN